MLIRCLALAIPALSGLGYSICKMEGLELGRPLYSGSSLPSLDLLSQWPVNL